MSSLYQSSVLLTGIISVEDKHGEDTGLVVVKIIKKKGLKLLLETGVIIQDTRQFTNFHWKTENMPDKLKKKS